MIGGLLRNAQHQLDRPGAVPRQPADPRRAVPLDPLPRAETELVIIVTPYLVRPVSNANQIALPTDGFRNPPTRRSASCSARSNAGRTGEQRPGPRAAEPQHRRARRRAPARPRPPCRSRRPAAGPPAARAGRRAAAASRPAPAQPGFELLMTARDRKDDRLMSRFISLAAVSALGLARRRLRRRQPRRADAGQQSERLFGPPAGGRAHQFRVRRRRRGRPRLAGRAASGSRAWFELDRPALRRPHLDRRRRRLWSTGARATTSPASLAEYGLLLADGAPVTAGQVPAGLRPRRRQPLDARACRAARIGRDHNGIDSPRPDTSPITAARPTPTSPR